MKRCCDVCGEEYEAKRKTSRYCSTKCRTQASRAGLSGPRGEVASAPPATGVVEATRAQLSEAGRLDSPKGQVAMLLARRLETPTADTGSAIAAVAARWEAMLDAALAGPGDEPALPGEGAPGVADIAAARARRLAEAEGRSSS